MKAKVLRILFLALSLLAGGAGAFAKSASGYYSYTLDVSEGLSSNIVYQIVKWKDDGVWMATSQGIDRYDGFSVQHYSLFKDDIRMSDDGQKISISTDGVHYLWAFTDSGRIYRYDAEGDEFELFLALSDLGVHALLNQLAVLDGRLYACTGDGILSIDVEERRLLERSLPGQNVKSVVPYVDGRILAGGTDGLVVMTYDLQMAERILPAEGIAVECIYVDPQQNRVFIGSDGRGLWKYEKGELLRIRDGLERAIVRSIARLDDNDLLIGCDGAGVFRTGRDGTGTELFATDLVPEGDLSLRTSSVYSILVDQGNIWVTSYRGGVTLFRKDSDVLLIHDVNESVASANFVHGICEGRGGDVWMAFNSAIGRYDPLTGELRKYLDKAGGFLSVAEDDEGFLWCGGYNTGAYRLDSRTGEAEFLPALTTGTGQDCIFSIRKDPDGHIWVGGLNFDLARYTVSGRTLTNRQYPIREVSDILPISRDTLLLGTNNGLYILDQASGETTAVSWADSTGHGVTTVINCLSYAPDRHEAWIGTEGGGLLCYNLRSGEILPFSTHDGLPSNYITGLEIDNLQRLWASTENSGLFVVDLQTRKVLTAFMRRNGLYTNEFFPGSSCLLSNGDVAFGGYYGAVVIPTATLFHSPEFKRITFTSLEVGSEKVTTKTHPHILGTTLDQARKVTLPYQARSFSLSVSTDDLYNQNAAQLYWRLRGSFEDWRVVGLDRTVGAEHLPPGKYILEIRSGERRDGSYAFRSVDVVAKQVLWLRWYALLFYALALAGITFQSIRAYNHRLEKNAFEDKIHFFTNVAHDIKTPLTLVAAPLEKLGKLMDEHPAEDEPKYLLSTARNNVKHLEGMVNQLMELGKMSLPDQAPESAPIDLKEAIGMVKYDYKTLADDQGLAFLVDIAPGEYHVAAPPQQLHRILDNLLSNAFKYTSEGGVNVRLSQEGNHAVVEVSDTGIGISPADAKKLFRFSHRGSNAVEKDIPGNGIGLFFTHTLVKKLGGDLTFRSILGTGSTFFLTLPLKEAPRAPEKEPAPAEAPAKAAGRSGHRETLLLVDDNNELRSFLAHALSDTYNTLDAASAEAALEILQESSVDLVISDIVMPGMHGDALCRQIKNHIETSHIPVILLTGVSDKEVMAESLSGGADDYITKPVDLEILELKIRSIFVNRRKLHSYYLSRMNLLQPEALAKQEGKPLQNDLDGQFLQKVAKAVRDNLANPDFSVGDLAGEVAMSRTLLYEKTRKLLGMAPNDFIREMRMKQAKALLEEGSLSVTDVAVACGFSDVRYFSTVFKKYYGVSPSKVSAIR